MEQLKSDIASFQALAASSDEKSIKYAEIMHKFQQIEAQGVWQADIKNLKELLSSTYEQGYNVARITSFTQLDDPSAGKKTELLTFSDAELKSLGTPVSLSAGAQINIAGQKAAMIGVINDSTRGSMVAYNGTTEAKECTSSISKKGLFCYSNGGELFYVAKTGVEAMETSDGERATRDL